MKSRAVMVINTLFFRGLGSGAAVLLTLLVTRYLETSAAATFLMLFNVTTVAAVCFRWGLDDLIVRREAAVTASKSPLVTAYLMKLVHRRVAIWVVVALVATSVLGFAQLQDKVGIDLPELFTAIAISGFIALTAGAGRVHQGQGRTNYAAFILNILLPGLLLLGLVLLVCIGVEVDSMHMQFLYAGLAMSAYIGIVWGSRLTRPSHWLWANASRSESELARVDRRAANMLGGVVLAQQALNWGALLTIPFAYGDQLFTTFMVAYKVALLISLVMFAVNFTFASRLAALFAARENAELKRVVRTMVIAVTVASGLAAGVVFLARDLVFSIAGIESHDRLLASLALSQVFFALSSVYALVLTMCNDEASLLKAQGSIVFLGVLVFVTLSFTAPLEVASAVFVATYLTLTLVLRHRVLRVISDPRLPRVERSGR